MLKPNFEVWRTWGPRLILKVSQHRLATPALQSARFQTAAARAVGEAYCIKVPGTAGHYSPATFKALHAAGAFAEIERSGRR